MSIRRWFVTITLILLLSAALRFHMLAGNVRFHPDEALFSTFARSAAVYGDWMLPGPLDKTPVSIYLSALSMHFTATDTNSRGVLDITVKQGEFAARLPNTYLSLILVALTASIARSIQPNEKRVALVAAGVMALSPYMLAFSASAFTDMAMVTFGTVVLLAALRGKSATSGVLLALSIASKQQGILYLPLALLLAQYADHLNRDWCLRWSIAFVMGIALLFAWDMARPGTSIFTLASTNNNPERLFATPGEWLSRLRTWLRYVGWLLGPPPLTWPLLGVSVAYTSNLRRRIDIILWGYTLAYFALHWLIGFNTYDRYLLPLVPILAILAGRGLVWFISSRPSIGERSSPPFLAAPQLTGKRRSPKSRWDSKSLSTNREKFGQGFASNALIVLSMLLFIGLIGGVVTSRWQIDLGRDHYPLDRDGEIITLADHLNAKPLGTIIYDPWLGWEMGYYLGAWSDKRRVHYPTPEALAHDAADNPEAAPRYLVAPRNQPLATWLKSLRDADFAISTDFETERFIVYRLLRQQANPDA